MNQHQITRKIRNIHGETVFAGYVLIFFGLAIFIFSALFEIYQGQFYIGGSIGFLILMVGLWLSFSYHGVDIDLKQKRIKNFKVYLGFKIGAWHKMPEFESVIVEKFDPEYLPSFKGITPAIRWYKIHYSVILAAGTDLQIISVKGDAASAFADAEFLSKSLNLDIIDNVKAKAYESHS